MTFAVNMIVMAIGNWMLSRQQILSSRPSPNERFLTSHSHGLPLSVITAVNAALLGCFGLVRPHTYCYYISHYIQ